MFNGVPAPYNLPVPPYRFVSDTTLRIGENDSSATAWDFEFDPAVVASAPPLACPLGRVKNEQVSRA